jgi:hypothetical protein
MNTTTKIKKMNTTTKIKKIFHPLDYILKKKNPRKVKYDHVFYADFETILVDKIDIESKSLIKKHIPIAMGFVELENNELAYNLSILNKDNKDILYSFFKSIDFLKKTQRKKDMKVLVYFHNFSKFDSFFILDYIADQSNILKYKIISSIERDNVLYELVLETETGAIIVFHDSFLIMSESLKDLSIDFKLGHEKLNFTNLNLTLEDFDNLNDKNIFKIESHLKTDLLILYEAMSMFNKIILSNFNVNIDSHVSISSIALEIFKLKYYNDDYENIIGKLNKVDEAFIRESFIGGLSEVYAPEIVSDGYYYDAVSLYPSIYASWDLPVGKPKRVEGKTINLDTFYGFLKVNVYCPDNIKRPILPVKDSNGNLLTPTGKFSGIYYSEELKLAKKYGYIFDVIEGIEFRRGQPLKNFAEALFKLRKTYGADTAGDRIIKKLLNSLYGRFGLRSNIEYTSYCNAENALILKNKYTCKPIKKLGEDLFKVKYNGQLNEKKLSLNHNEYEVKELCDKQMNKFDAAVQISSAISSASRIFMYPFKEDESTYYTDVDSLIMSKPLDPKFINPDKLGFFKEKKTNLSAIFLARKLYCVYSKNTENSVTKYDIIARGIPKFNVDGEERKNILTLDFFNGCLLEKNNVTNNMSLEYTYNNNFIRKDQSILSEQRTVTINPHFHGRNKVYKNGRWIATTPLKVNLPLWHPVTKKRIIIKSGLIKSLKLYEIKTDSDILL